MQTPGPRQQCRFPAPVNDQWNYLLSTIWNQTMHLVVILDGRLDEGRLRDSAERVLEAEPLLTCRFVEAIEPHWEAIPSFRPESIFSVAGQEGDRDLALREVLTGKIDPGAGPQAHFDLVRGDTDMLIISVNHSVCDARGILHVSGLCARAYRAQGNNSGSFPSGRFPCDRSFHPLLSALSDEERAVARHCCDEQSAEWGMPWAPGARGSAEYSVRTIGPPLFGAVKAYSRSMGVTVNDILIAAFFASVRREIPHQEGRNYPVLTSTDLRRIHPGVRSPGVANLSVAFEVWLPAGMPGRPHDLVIAAHRAMDEKKRLRVGIGSAIRLEEMFSSGFDQVREHLLEAKHRSWIEGYPKNPFISNIGILPHSCVDFGHPQTMAAYIVPPVEYPPGFGIAASTFDSTLTLSCGFCDGPIAGRTVERVLTSMGEFLSALTRE